MSQWDTRAGLTEASYRRHRRVASVGSNVGGRPVASGRLPLVDAPHPGDDLGRVRKRELPYQLGVAPIDELVDEVVGNSRGKLALALNMGDAARTYGVKRGMVVVVRHER